MRLLVLGGTAWLGRQVAATAAAAGHEVTCLARGEAGPPAAGVELVRADRDGSGAYDEVVGRSWEAVVDVSRQPGQVRRAAGALAGSCRTYVFVSSGNVYADHATPGQDESAPLLPPLAGEVMESMETYGEAKVACERAVLEAVGPRRVLIVRAGLIGGPQDPFDRGGYWPWRFARPAAADGSVLVPDAADAPTQLIDVRDLAAWLVDAAAAGAYGTVNAVGETLPFGEHLAIARKVAGHSGPVVVAPGDWLLARGVRPWMGERSLPLWLPDPAYAGFACRTGSAARALGLTTRPLEATLADTLAWELSRDPGPRRAGLSDDAERALLAELGLTPVPAPDHLAALRAEGDLLAEAARAGSWDAPVPFCPGWVLRDVVVHLGWVYRWVRVTVSEGRPPDRDRRAALQDPDPADRPGALERFARAHAGLVTALAEAPADLDCWTVWPAPSPRTFWRRRQAHETLVHRVDVQNAASPGLRDGSDLAPALAADGVDELVRGFLHRFGDDLRHPDPVTLGLHATDTGECWWVRMGPGPPSSGQGAGDGPADAEVHARAGELLLLLWNRRAADGLDVRGDGAVLAAWRTGARR